MAIAPKKFAKATDAEVERMNALIDIAQGYKRSVSVAEKEEAIVTLLTMFKNLIRKIAKQVYRQSSGFTWEEWEHEATTLFFELLVDDYVPRSRGGAAGFTHYVQTKLYLCLLYFSQTNVRHYERQKCYSMTDAALDVHASSGFAQPFTPRYVEGRVPRELIRALLEMTTDVEEIAGGNLRDGEHHEMVAELFDIVRTFEEREQQIFNMYFCSGMFAKDIGPAMDPPISKSRVNQIANQVRQKIHQEFGRRFMQKRMA